MRISTVSLHRGRLHQHRLEAALQGAVLLDVLAVFVEGRGADALQLAARQRGLEHVGRVDGALGGSRADQCVQLVDEENDVLVLGDLVHHGLEPLLELAAVLGAGDDRRHVEREHAMVAQHVGAVAARDHDREAFDDGGLAHAGLADQDRVVLLAARQDLHDPLDFLLAADGRIELAFAGELGQVAAEMVERGRLRLLLGARRLALGGRRRGAARLGLRHVAAEQPQRLRARLLQGDPGVVQHLRGDALLLAQQAEQQVLGADVGVVELAGFRHRQLEHLLGARRVRQVRPGDGAGFPLLDRLLDLLLDFLEIDVEIGQDSSRDTFALADEAKEDVLGAHVFVVQPGSLLPRHLEDFANPISEVVAVHTVPRGQWSELQGPAHEIGAAHRQLVLQPTQFPPSPTGAQAG